MQLRAARQFRVRADCGASTTAASLPQKWMQHLSHCNRHQKR